MAHVCILSPRIGADNKPDFAHRLGAVLVWNFFVFQRVSESFQSYFESNGRPQPGDYGRGMGLAFSILAVCSVIPCVGCFTGIAALVLLILTLVKFSGYKSLILRGGGAFPM